MKILGGGDSGRLHLLVETVCPYLLDGFEPDGGDRSNGFDSCPNTKAPGRALSVVYIGAARALS